MMHRKHILYDSSSLAEALSRLLCVAAGDGVCFGQTYVHDKRIAGRMCVSINKVVRKRMPIVKVRVAQYCVPARRRRDYMYVVLVSMHILFHTTRIANVNRFAVWSLLCCDARHCVSFFGGECRMEKEAMRFVWVRVRPVCDHLDGIHCGCQTKSVSGVQVGDLNTTAGFLIAFSKLDGIFVKLSGPLSQRVQNRAAPLAQCSGFFKMWWNMRSRQSGGGHTHDVLATACTPLRLCFSSTGRRQTAGRSCSRRVHDVAGWCSAWY